jgi:nitroreductase
LEHIERKKRTIRKKTGEDKKKYSLSDFRKILQVIENRRSQRIFISKEKIDNVDLQFINKAVVAAPSSCNRQAIHLKLQKPSKDFLEPLVGGRGWCHKANMILMLYADMTAYKSPNEVEFMPYLDAGFVAQNIYLICEVMDIGCCYINPHTKPKGKYDKKNLKFMGAFALGYYDKKAICPPKREYAWIQMKK